MTQRHARRYPYGLIGLGLLLGAPLAQAEELIFVTANSILLRDSANPAVAIDGLPFTLPAGFVAVGGDADPDDGDVHVLARNAGSGQCQLFEGGDPAAAGDSLPLTADGPSFSCSATVGDVELQDQPFEPSDHLTADGNVIRVYVPEDDASFDAPVVSSAGVTVNLVALTQRTDSDPIYGINRGGAGAIGVLDDSDFDVTGQVVLNNAMSLSGANVSGPTSLDISPDGSTLYLLTAGNLYSVTAAGVSTLLGTAPTGAVAVFVDLSGSNNGGGGNNTGGDGGGSDEDDDESSSIKVGAFGVWGLVPLILLGLLRLRARFRQARQRA